MRDADKPLSKDGTPEFYRVYKECVDVGLSPLLTTEVREKMQAKEKLEKPLKWFVLPNESYKWDFIIEKYIGEDDEIEAFIESFVIKRQANDCFNKD